MTTVDTLVRAVTATICVTFGILLLANGLRLGDPIILLFALFFGLGAGALMLVPRDEP